MRAELEEGQFSIGYAYCHFPKYSDLETKPHQVHESSHSSVMLRSNQVGQSSLNSIHSGYYMTLLKLVFVEMALSYPKSHTWAKVFPGDLFEVTMDRVFIVLRSVCTAYVSLNGFKTAGISIDFPNIYVLCPSHSSLRGERVCIWQQGGIGWWSRAPLHLILQWHKWHCRS